MREHSFLHLLVGDLEFHGERASWRGPASARDSRYRPQVAELFSMGKVSRPEDVGVGSSVRGSLQECC